MNATRVLVALVCGLLLLSSNPESSVQKPSRSPDVPFQSSPKEVVLEMLKLANVSKDDVVYDLGSGDGRILIAAAQLYQARGVGIDIDPRRTREGLANARREGVLNRIRFRTEDLFKANITEATVVTLFLWPKVNLKLRSKLWRDLKPGTRVVSYVWDMGDWAPEKRTEVNGDPVYLWIIPSVKPKGDEMTDPPSIGAM
jgi:SAM-dependent methyltransferase